MAPADPAAPREPPARPTGGPARPRWYAAGIDGQNPVDLNELDLICIDPLPSYVWYQDMADFAGQISDARAGRRLARSIDGRGAFRRFNAELREEYPHLLPVGQRTAGLSCSAARCQPVPEPSITHRSQMR